MKQKKNEFVIRNSDSRLYLIQFKNFTKCESLEDFLSLSNNKRKEIVEDYLSLIKRSNTEKMYADKVKMLFTYLFKKRKLTMSTKEIFDSHPIKQPLRFPLK